MAEHDRFIHQQPADRYQRSFTLLSQFGFQSNIIVAASYESLHNPSSKDGLLSKALLYPALRKVVQWYPELAMVTWCRPSETKKGQHRRWVGFLRELNLDGHVRFLNDHHHDRVPAAEGLDAALFEQYHDIWFDDPEKPPWQLLVVNGKHVVFVFHHLVTDGRGATQVHRSLLEALDFDFDRDESPIVQVSADTVPGFPEKDPIARAGTSVSIVTTIWLFFLMVCIRQLYRFTDAFFHDARVQEIGKLSFSNPEKEKHLVKTQVRTLRLEAATVKNCIDACRAHKTSFTSLLHTLIKVTLATDLYPTSHFSHSQVVVDIRPYLLPHARAQTMSPASSMVQKFDRLSRFRRAGSKPPSHADDNDDTAAAAAVNAPLLWDIARDHRAHVVADFNHGKVWRKAWQSIELVGEDEEDYISQVLPGSKYTQENCFSVSNLGVFDSGETKRWTISNMQFSAGAIKAGYGANLTLNVVGVRGGATVIHASTEEGSLRDGFVDLLLERVQQRLEAII
ncbi:hypothetical protein PISL3812_05943 [Talaromyces islandicus]|uniref:Uncharacterized protein n=1 Tax=Talaromyces islandicus TaxID=28573 RepID=A0A0U1M030_TALIS|nr:hypothetical protein PISL3812_05943 [Talaromyces islandicus]